MGPLNARRQRLLSTRPILEGAINRLLTVNLNKNKIMIGNTVRRNVNFMNTREYKNIVKNILKTKTNQNLAILQTLFTRYKEPGANMFSKFGIQNRRPKNNRQSDLF